MMKEVKKDRSSGRLRNLQYKLKVVQKSRKYLKKELPRLRDSELVLREKIRKEKKAISLMNRVKKLR